MVWCLSVYIYMIVKDGTEDVEMVWCLSVYIYMIVKDGTEDVEMGWCLSKIGVKPTMSRDSKVDI